MVNVNSVRLKEKGPEAVLSPLEADILRALWKCPDCRVRDIYNKLKNKKDIALSSIAVSLDRMHKRGVVKRKIEKGRGGLHYIYTPAVSEAGFERSLIEGVVDKLIDNFGQGAVNYFNERFKKGE